MEPLSSNALSVLWGQGPACHPSNVPPNITRCLPLTALYIDTSNTHVISVIFYSYPQKFLLFPRFSCVDPFSHTLMVELKGKQTVRRYAI